MSCEKLNRQNFRGVSIKFLPNLVKVEKETCAYFIKQADQMLSGQSAGE
jgi:hypothetical protein